MILGISFSPLINSDELVSKSIIETSSESTSVEQIYTTENYWNQISGESHDGFSIKELSGKFNLAHGSFDPLTDELPPLPYSYIDNNDFETTAMKFIQLHDYDYRWLNQLEEKGHLTILDLLGDGNFVIRILPTHGNTLEILSNSEQLRWIENVHPGYRLHPQLLFGESHDTVAVIPTNDLGYGGYEELALDLVNYGAHDAWCGYSMCQAKIGDDTNFLFDAARDGRILWVEPIYSMQVHNGVARHYFRRSFARWRCFIHLDGSGEMLAIADTGLDRDHPDIAGKLQPYTLNFGLDTSPTDSNGGHGTRYINCYWRWY